MGIGFGVTAINLKIYTVYIRVPVPGTKNNPRAQVKYSITNTTQHQVLCTVYVCVLVW